MVAYISHSPLPALAGTGLDARPAGRLYALSAHPAGGRYRPARADRRLTTRRSAQSRRTTRERGGSENDHKRKRGPAWSVDTKPTRHPTHAISPQRRAEPSARTGIILPGAAVRNRTLS